MKYEASQYLSDLIEIMQSCVLMIAAYEATSRRLPNVADLCGEGIIDNQDVIHHFQQLIERINR